MTKLAALIAELSNPPTTWASLDGKVHVFGQARFASDVIAMFNQHRERPSDEAALSLTLAAASLVCGKHPDAARTCQFDPEGNARICCSGCLNDFALAVQREKESMAQRGYVEWRDGHGQTHRVRVPVLDSRPCEGASCPRDAVVGLKLCFECQSALNRGAPVIRKGAENYPLNRESDSAGPRSGV